MSNTGNPQGKNPNLKPQANDQNQNNTGNTQNNNPQASQNQNNTKDPTKVDAQDAALVGATNAANDTANDAANKSAEEAAKDAAKQVAKDVAKEVAKQVAKEVANSVVKNAVKNAMKEVDIIEKFPPTSSRLQQISQPSMISYINLYNNHRHVLKPEKVLRLKETITDFRKYSQVISDNLKVLIVDKSKGLDQNQASQLQMQIMENLENFVAAKTGEVPKFLDSACIFQSLKIVCADEFTVDWLKKQITTINKTPPWERLQVKRMSSYINLANRSKKLILAKPKPPEPKVKFVIPINVKKAEFDEIIKRIAIRNPPIKTEGWTKLKEEATPKGTMYYASISNDSMKEIKNKDFRLFYMLGTIKIDLLTDVEISACENKTEKKPENKTENKAENKTDNKTDNKVDNQTATGNKTP